MLPHILRSQPAWRRQRRPRQPSPTRQHRTHPLSTSRCRHTALRQARGLGLARIVEIDPTGGPGFGFEHFKQYDFLRDKEVVLTFDDGPWPGNTPAVLKALTDECLKATFFEIGEHATWHPGNHQTGDRGRHDRRHPYLVA